ncbi:hypothetical protein BBJ28_00019487 [Nothophytophthora sp. Chile5]|nr:hypothetical protein BBJ28_00019487 [Nothophytophthora sp. Chile5]
MTTATTKPLRVLCMHGFRTNAQVMQAQTRDLREALAGDTEFVFLDAPFEAAGPSDPIIEGRFASSAPFFEWWRNETVDGSDIPLNDAKSSLNVYNKRTDESTDWYMSYAGLDEAMAFMDEQLQKHGPFDVVVGFSQGSVMHTILTMWYLKHRNTRLWKLSILVCSVRVGGVNCRDLFEDEEGQEIQIPVPSVHIVGKKDPLYALSHQMTDMYADMVSSPKLVMEHEGGHRFPSAKGNPGFYKQLVDFIMCCCRGGDGSSMARLLPHPLPDPPTPLAATEKIRVLCLHGFRTNTQVMLDQTRGIRAALGDSAEFVFLNGAFEARGSTDPMIESAYASSAPFYEWWENQLADGSPLVYNDAASSAKARLRSGADKGDDHAWSLRYEGVEQSMARIDSEIRRLGPFDVVIGFSQGAALLSILTMWYLRYGNTRWWKLAICVGGVDVSAVNVRPLFVNDLGNRVPVPLPSIHIIGKSDPLYHESHRLVLSWADTAGHPGFTKWVFEHDGGHKFPSVSRNGAFYAELARVITQYCRGEVGTNTLSKL